VIGRGEFLRPTRKTTTTSLRVTHERFQRCNLFGLCLDEVVAHAGHGAIRSRRIADASDLSGACNFLDYTTMPPGTSIGEHTHALDEEEYYLILSGEGRMRRDGEEFAVRAGDLVRNQPGGTHALVNTGQEELRLFVFEVRVV
jgi:mannose-6-phosphate isomerase-like protein (cupin superfamily)